MMRAPPLALLLAALATWPAAGQTALPAANSTAGNVSSAQLRGGYPVGGGAVSLPLQPQPTTTGTQTIVTPNAGATGPGAASIGSTSFGSGSGGAGGVGGGARGGLSGAAATTPSRGAKAAGSGNWVLCPPAGSSDLAPFLDGTALSCAPQ